MYGLVALGYHITWATSRTMNFSQGHAVMVGAVVAYAVFVGLGWPFPLALLVSLAALALFGALVERIAVGIIAENVAQLTFGKDARAFPSPLMKKPIMVGSVGFYPQEVLVPLVGLLLMGLVQLFYHRTGYGKQLKAVAWNPEAAGLMGINISRAVMASYALSALLAGVAGVLLAPLLNVAPQMGTIIGLKAFAVAIIGGLTSAPGIVVAGLGYGLVESFTAGYVSTRAREIVGSGLVIAVLIARPWGLLGEKPSRRV